MPERKDFGDALVESAVAPIQKANARLREGAIREGLDALSKAELLAGLRHGIEKAAALFGFRVSEVEALLPWDVALPALDRLEAAQIAAARTFREHASGAGGQIAGLSGGAVAADVRRQTGAEALSSVAKRFVRDKHLREPLEALSAEISAWESLVSQCGDRLESSTLHARYVRRTLLVRVSIGIVLVSVVSVVGASAYKKKQVEDARARVLAALGAEDPCAVEALAPEDMARAMPDQAAREKTRLGACATERALARYEAACEALAKGFEAGKLSEEDLAFAKEAAPRLARAQKHELTTEDLLATPKDMPCQDAPAKDRFFPTYARAAAASTKAWAEATRVSDDIRAALLKKELASAKAYQEELARRAEPAAARAILSGKPEDMEQGKKLCDFAGSFGIEPGKKCAGLAGILAKKP